MLHFNKQLRTMRCLVFPFRQSCEGWGATTDSTDGNVACYNQPIEYPTADWRIITFVLTELCAGVNRILNRVADSDKGTQTKGHDPKLPRRLY